jgi:hypothetical protein
MLQQLDPRPRAAIIYWYHQVLTAAIKNAEEVPGNPNLKRLRQIALDCVKEIQTSPPVAQPAQPAEPEGADMPGTKLPGPFYAPPGPDRCPKHMIEIDGECIELDL